MSTYENFFSVFLYSYLTPKSFWLLSASCFSIGKDTIMVKSWLDLTHLSLSRIHKQLNKGYRNLVLAHPYYFHSDIFVIKCQFNTILKLVYFQSGSRFGISYEVQIYSDVGSKQYRIMVISNKL